MNTTRTLIATAAAMLLAAPAFAQDTQTSPTDTGVTPSQSSQSESMHSQGTQGEKSAKAMQKVMQKDPQMVRQIQQKLQDQGFDVGEIDGKWGPQTANALKDFQRQQGMQADGKLSQSTLSALGVQGSDSMATGQQSPGTGGGATGSAESMSPQDATGGMDDATRGATGGADR